MILEFFHTAFNMLKEDFYLIIKLIIGFTLTIIHFNYSGKTQVSQMNAIDFIGNFILGGIIGGVLYSDSISFTQYISFLIIGIFFINFLNWLVKKIPYFKAFAVGEPITIMENGELKMKTILNKDNKVNIYNIASNLRILGHSSFSEIEFLQIEPNGQLTVIPKDSKQKYPSVIIYSNSTKDTEGLKFIDKDGDWLDEVIKKLNVESYDDVFLIEYYENKPRIILNDGTIRS